MIVLMTCRPGAPCREVAAGAGDDRRDDRAGRMGPAGPGHRQRRHPAGGCERRRVRRVRGLPAGAGDPRLAIQLTGRPHDAAPAAWPYGGRGRPSVPRYRTAPVSLRQLAIAHAGQIQPVTWRQGTKATRGNPDAAMTSHFIAIRVRPGSRRIPRAKDSSQPGCWLLAEWPPQADEPTDYWLSNLPADTPIAELVRQAKIRWRVEHDYRELKTGLSLDHFEGRSYLGWHRHVTLAVLAQAFCTMIRTDPKARARDDPLPGPARVADRPGPDPRRLPPVPPAVNPRPARRRPRREPNKVLLGVWATPA